MNNKLENNENDNDNDNDIYNYSKIIKIKETLETGKFIESKIDMKLGEIILKVQSPMCFSFHKHLVKKICYNCFMNSNDTKNPKFNKYKVDNNKNYIIGCSGCSLIYFCSDECFEKVMSKESFQDSTSTHIHTPLECLILSVFRENQTKSPNINTLHDQTENRMIINYLSKIAYSNIGFEKFDSLVLEMNQLVGGFNQLSTKFFKKEEIENIKNKSYMLKRLFSKFFFQIGDGIIEELYAKSQRNSFGLWKNSDECFGLSMYGCQTNINNNNSNNNNEDGSNNKSIINKIDKKISVSFFNHSCFPNCVRVQENQSISFYTLIPIKKGDELTISYIDIRMSLTNRLIHLNECYYFECKCKRCTLPSSSTLSLEIENIIQNYICKNESIKCTGSLYLPPNNQTQRICNFCKWKESD
ncbi:hypothetical protein RB653_001518 [Dictyostelium firmibasis]|uniref:SET domain-containing protein n=1 Tax=Dictyostelium firmibasis TaxID=79012 RepID=A0AAN7U493_9MYCE